MPVCQGIVKHFFHFIDTFFDLKFFSVFDVFFADIISEKYALLGINLTSDQISTDAIDTEIDTLNVISLVNYIKLSHMSIDEMKLICDIKKIDYKLEEEVL